MPDTDSLALLTRWRNGDQQAASVIVERYLDRLIALARSRLSPKVQRRTDPDDVVQSALNSFFRQAGQEHFVLKRGDTIWPLLAAITVHKALRLVDHHQAQKRAIEKEGSMNVAGWAVPPEAIARDPTPDEAGMIAEELQELMRDLEQRHRHVLELHLQGLSTDEIGETVKLTTRSVHRILAQVREDLEQRLLASGAEKA